MADGTDVVSPQGENVLRAASLCDKLEQATTSRPPHGGDDERPGASPPSEVGVQTPRCRRGNGLKKKKQQKTYGKLTT